MKNKRKEQEKNDVLFALLILVFFAGIFTLWTTTAKARTPKQFYSFPNAKFVSVIDGDTIKVNIPSIHPLFGMPARIRILGIDTPELRSKNPEERAMAKLAKDFVIKKLADSKRFRVSDCLPKSDSFGRPLCRISTKEFEDLGQELLKAGLAKVYEK